jgi:hypothetical protein
VTCPSIQQVACRAPLFVEKRVDFCRAAAARTADGLALRPFFCPDCRAMHLDPRAVDHGERRRFAAFDQRREYPLLYAALAPAIVSVEDRYQSSPGSSGLAGLGAYGCREVCKRHINKVSFSHSLLYLPV